MPPATATTIILLTPSIRLASWKNLSKLFPLVELLLLLLDAPGDRVEGVYVDRMIAGDVDNDGLLDGIFDGFFDDFAVGDFTTGVSDSDDGSELGTSDGSFEGS